MAMQKIRPALLFVVLLLCAQEGNSRRLKGNARRLKGNARRLKDDARHQILNNHLLAEQELKENHETNVAQIFRNGWLGGKCCCTKMFGIDGDRGGLEKCEEHTSCSGIRVEESPRAHCHLFPDGRKPQSFFDLARNVASKCCCTRMFGIDGDRGGLEKCEKSLSCSGIRVEESPSDHCHFFPDGRKPQSFFDLHPPIRASPVRASPIIVLQQAKNVAARKHLAWPVAEEKLSGATGSRAALAFAWRSSPTRGAS